MVAGRYIMPCTSTGKATCDAIQPDNMNVTEAPNAAIRLIPSTLTNR